VINDALDALTVLVCAFWLGVGYVLCLVARGFIFVGMVCISTAVTLRKGIKRG
jgi:hypothetical protein